MLQFRMFLYLSCALFSIYSVHSAPAEPSVLETILKSSNDANYKCPLLRKSKLFDEVPNLLKECPNFTRAKLLTTLKDEDINDGLCILYYNNFEHLCYLTNTAEHILIDSAIPTLFTNKIELVCETLLNNTLFVENAKPGIDAITSALQSNCPRICTHWNGNVRPICSLAAYVKSIAIETASKGSVGSVGNSLTGGKKDTVLKGLSFGRSKGTAASPNIPKPDSDGTNFTKPKTDKIKSGAPLELTQKVIKKDETSNNLNENVHSDPNPVVDAAINTSKKVDFVNPSQINEEQGKEHPNQEVQIQQIELDNKTASKPNTPGIRINVQYPETNKQQNGVKVYEIPSKPDLLKTSGSDKQNGIDIPQAADKPDKLQNATNANVNIGNINSNFDSVKINDQLEFNKKPQVKKPNLDLITTSTDKPEEAQVQKDIDKTNSNIIGVKDYNAAKEEEKEGLPDDDLEIDEGIVPAGEGIQDYGDDVAPKPSEVKSKAEIVKSSEKLKPLQTDEERYTISANYQNQNVDDSGSYFFSYFMMFCIIFVCAYVAYHNKQKILALVVEGRRGRRPSRSRRPNSANYRKLDSNLEEAVTSTCNKSAPQVIY